MAGIGIVSIYDMNNVGNRLQSFALYRALESLGHHPTVIPNTPYAPPGAPEAPATESVVETARRLVSARDWWALGEKARRMLVMTLRGRALRRFTAAYLRVDPRAITAPGEGERLREDYDVFVAGSDQIWNPGFRSGSPTDFLRFARPGQRIAYAASFGVAALPEEYARHYREMLDGFEQVSVREHSGADIIADLVGRDVDVTLDPTMLLPVEEWHRLADRAPRQPNTPYLATYLLWKSDRETHRGVATLARSLRLRTRRLMSPGSRHPDFYGVENFLRTIRDAEAVVTDSFHSTLFALLFRTPVRVISRGPGQDDRIESLLEIFGVPAAQAFGAADEPPAGPLVADPESALGPHRRRSLDWLAAAISAAGPAG